MFSIVQKLGGEVYNGGHRAMIPGPGHSHTDRSVSLLLSADGKVRVHAFSDHDWRHIMDWLKAEKLVTDDHRLIEHSISAAQTRPVPTDRDKQLAAIGIWQQGYGVSNSLSATWLRRHRKVRRDLASLALRHNPQVPLQAYSTHCRHHRPAFLAKVTDRAGAHTGTEITYLDALGRRDLKVRIPRKLIGAKPAGAAVWIDPVESEMVIAEGVPSALSASQYFSLPCHALLGVKSYPAWRPPEGVRRVVIAAEPGPAGERFSQLLLQALRQEGYGCRREFPPAPHGDFNAFFGGQG